MSRFLANLMERASQPTVAIRPVLPSLFGAAGNAAGWMKNATMAPTSEALESPLPIERRDDVRPQEQQAAERQMRTAQCQPGSRNHPNH